MLTEPEVLKLSLTDILTLCDSLILIEVLSLALTLFERLMLAL